MRTLKILALLLISVNLLAQEKSKQSYNQNAILYVNAVKTVLSKLAENMTILEGIQNASINGVHGENAKLVVDQNLVFAKEIMIKKLYDGDKNYSRALLYELVPNKDGIILKAGITDVLRDPNVSNLIDITEGNNNVRLYFYVKTTNEDDQQFINKIITLVSIKFMKENYPHNYTSYLEKKQQLNELLDNKKKDFLNFDEIIDDLNIQFKKRGLSENILKLLN
jgi:hypothetical protein